MHHPPTTVGTQLPFPSLGTTAAGHVVCLPGQLPPHTALHRVAPTAEPQSAQHTLSPVESATRSAAFAAHSCPAVHEVCYSGLWHFVEGQPASGTCQMSCTSAVLFGT